MCSPITACGLTPDPDYVTLYIHMGLHSKGEPYSLCEVGHAGVHAQWATSTTHLLCLAPCGEQVAALSRLLDSHLVGVERATQHSARAITQNIPSQ